MKLLLDTHVVLSIIGSSDIELPRSMLDALAATRAVNLASTASLWEIAIKARSGKLRIASIAVFGETCVAYGMRVLPITPAHVLAEVLPEPGTRDPFDRSLLARAQIEGARLVTLDRALAGHPLARQAA